MCTTCGFATESPADYHPYAFCALVKQLGGKSAEANLAAVLRHDRSDDPALKRHVDEFIARAGEK